MEKNDIRGKKRIYFFLCVTNFSPGLKNDEKKSSEGWFNKTVLEYPNNIQIHQSRKKNFCICVNFGFHFPTYSEYSFIPEIQIKKKKNFSKNS